MKHDPIDNPRRESRPTADRSETVAAATVTRAVPDRLERLERLDRVDRPDRPDRPWRRAWSVRDIALLVLGVFLVTWAFRPAVLDILDVGLKNPEQSQVLLAPLVAFWLFWLRRSRLRSLRVAPSYWGPALIAAGWGIHLLGLELDAEVLWHGGYVVALVGACTAFTGPGILRAFLPAVLALLFLIPVPGTIRSAIAVPLQELAAVVTQSVLEVLGVRVTRTGYMLAVNGKNVAVAEACNGMRMVFALLVVVYTFAFSVRLRPGAAFLLVLFSPFIAIVCNVVRLVPTAIVIGFGSEQAAEAFHDLAGWMMLPFALLIAVWGLRLARWMELPVMSFRLPRG